MTDMTVAEAKHEDREQPKTIRDPEWSHPRDVRFLWEQWIPRGGVTIVYGDVSTFVSPMSTGGGPFPEGLSVMQWRGDTTALENRMYQLRPDAVILYEPSSVEELTKIATRHRCAIITVPPVDGRHHARSVIRIEDGALRHVLCRVADTCETLVSLSQLG